MKKTKRNYIHPRSWKQWEIDLLKEHYRKLPAIEIGQLCMNRSKAAVVRMAFGLRHHTESELVNLNYNPVTGW